MRLNLRFLLACTVIAFTGVSLAQSQDVAPNTAGNVIPSDDRAQFDMQYQFGIGDGFPNSVGYNGLAGVALINNEFWISQWSTDRIIILNFDGTLKVDTVVSGVTGTRSITYDGTSVYFGGASTAIYQIDPSNYTLQNIINITTSSDAEARMCTYDATLDGGNGGFWIGDFSSDIASVSMTGNELSVIPAATHGLTIYGGAFDNLSPDGPWLWVHDQTGTAPNRCNIVQVNPTTGVPTGVSYDYYPNALPTTTGALAGGLFVSSESVSGTNSLIGLSQSTPANELFSIELTSSSASLTQAESLSLELFPNPADDIVRITTGVAGNLNVEVHDITGKKVMDKMITDNQMNTSGLTTGIYLVKVTQNGITSTEKLVIK